MNNLKNIMDLRDIKAKELAQRSGVALSIIRRTMNNTQVTPFLKTAEKLADALGVNCAQIYATQPAARGDNEILFKRLDDATQALVRALGDFTSAPTFSTVVITTGNADRKSTVTINTQDMNGAEIITLNTAVAFNEFGALVYWENKERRQE